MKSANQVDELIKQLKADGVPLSDAVWETACACVGWPYVFGAEGQKTTKDGIEVRKFDCQGFTEWCLWQFGINIKAAGATSQWNNNRLWKAKGAIDSIPDDVLVCLFYQDKKDPSKMAHTGFGYKGQTCECSVGVQHFTKRKAKWQYWAIPKGITDKEPVPDPDYKPTLRKGDKNEYVKQMQELLLAKGYDLGKWGADGSFGDATLTAVKAFQQANGLDSDGVCGKKTWAALTSETPVTILYTVTVPHMTKYQAEGLVKQYTGAYMTEERS